MKSLYLFAIAAVCTLSSYGQLGNSISEDRYQDIEKSPYLFAEFVPAKVYDKSKNKTDNYVINYNGYTEDFEFMHNGKIYALDTRRYDVVEVEKYTPNPDYSVKFASTSAKFVKGLDAKNKSKFQILIFANEDMTVFKRYNAKLTETKSTDSGRGIVNHKFFSTFFSYYTVQDGSQNMLRLNKKKILSTLNNTKVEEYAKKNKLKLMLR
jgi:hypothetical protein